MGDKRRARGSLKLWALLLAALLMCATLPTGALASMDFTFNLGAVESFDDAETPEPTEEAGEPEDVSMSEPEDVSMGLPEDMPMDVSAGDGDAEFDSLDSDADAQADVDMQGDANMQDDAGAQDAFDAPEDADDVYAEDDPAETDGQEEAAGTGVFADVTAPTYPAQITITAAGDVVLGGASRNKTDQRFASVARKGGADYFFSNLRGVFEKDDLTIVNLEGPLTNSTDKKKGQYYNFKGYPAYSQILSGSSVEICNVANDHILDFGTSGLTETAQVLQSAGIGVSGFTQSYTTTIRGVRVTSLGFTQWNHSVEEISRAVTVARRECDILIVSMHWGSEKTARPDATQVAMGHAAVDAGADLVLGTHPYVYGGIEKYRGKYIVYSLGVFCFGGKVNPSEKRCMVFQQTLSYSPTTGVSDAGINIIPCTNSSSAKTNDYRPAMMGGQAGSALLRDVARSSVGMSMANTVWMSDNYMVRSGITTQEQLDAASAAAMAANNPAPAAATNDAAFQDEAEPDAAEGDTFEAVGDTFEDDDAGEDDDASFGEDDAVDGDDLDAAWDFADTGEAPAENAAAEAGEDSSGDFNFDLSEMN